MSKNILIGLVGLKGSGKDTMGDMFVKDYDFIKKSFADPLKEACKHLFVLSDEQLWGDLKETPDPRWDNCTPREILQYVGSELLRDQLGKIMPNINRNVHVHNMRLWLNENLSKYQFIICPDCRFEEEINLIKSMGGIIIKIDRNTVTSKVMKLLEEHANASNDNAQTKKLSLHQSEIALLNFKNYDHLFENKEGQFDEMKIFVNGIMRSA